jgi:hypothetical protein
MRPMRLEWTIGSSGKRGRRGDARRSPICPFGLCLSYNICKGDPYPENGAQRTQGVEDFSCSGLHAGAAAGFFCLSFVYIPLRCERL